MWVVAYVFETWCSVKWVKGALKSPLICVTISRKACFAPSSAGNSWDLRSSCAPPKLWGSKTTAQEEHVHVQKLCRSSERHRQRPPADTWSASAPAPTVSSVLDQRQSRATFGHWRTEEVMQAIHVLAFWALKLQNKNGFPNNTTVLENEKDHIIFHWSH